MAVVQDSRAEGTFVRLSTVARLFDVHPATLRRASDDGRLPCGRFGARQDRRFRLDDVRRWMGISESDQGEGIQQREDRDGALRVCLACRTSTIKQDSSLENQRTLLTEFLDSDPRFKGKRLEISWAIGRGASGMNSAHPWIAKLIAEIQANRFDYLIAKDKSRILRFAGNLIEIICRAHNCEVIYVNDNALDDDLTQDIIDVCTSFANRVSGRKSSLVTTKKIGAQTLEWAAKQQRNGVSIRSIYAQLRKDSLNRCQRGRTFSYRTLARALGTNADVLNAALSGEAENSFRAFVKAKMSRTKASDAVLTRSQIQTAYEAYCGEQNLPVASTQTIVRTWKELGGKITRPNNQTRYVGYVFSPCLRN